ncbi:MAG: aspartate/glutamate racemase family protein [Burkholderiaceae bacterium]
MTTRIWHQSFTVLGDLPAYRELLEARIRKVVRPDTEVVMHGQLPGTYSSDYPGADIRYRALNWLHGLQWLTAALEAQRQGFDAMVLATIPSPLIGEIRTLVDIPVVGYGDTAFHLSGLYGRRVGLLFFNPNRGDYWPEQVREWGVSERFAGISPAGVSFAQVAGALADPAKRPAVIAAIRATGERLVEEKGVDVIVPGEMPMNLLLAEEGVNRIGGATVIDGIATTFKMAETMLDLKRLSGMEHSERGYFHDRPPAERVEQVLKFYGLDALRQRIAKG